MSSTRVSDSPGSEMATSATDVPTPHATKSRPPRPEHLRDEPALDHRPRRGDGHLQRDGDLAGVSAGLMITLLGLPLLAGTLLVARGVGVIERRRAATLFGATPVAPAHRGHGLRDRLTDAADWRAVAYSLLLFPVGVVAGTVTVAGWATAVAAVTAPAYVGWSDDSSRQIAGMDLGGPVAAVISVLAGVALLMLMPTIVRNLARVQKALVRRTAHLTACDPPATNHHYEGRTP